MKCQGGKGNFHGKQALVNKKQPQTENKVGQLLEEVLLCACNSHKIMVTLAKEQQKKWFFWTLASDPRDCIIMLKTKHPKAWFV